ncbi:hypothetical protein F2Q68_00016479 [Brassica cretica]|uniref:RNase H type-1 domain-containing protein n=1 Tax=Brassica cretica TaxID=69181 RepID=A0A8S9HBS3_BRACR|nr:hypothetical protein F2Q68_00016479 [Brassica cretica]
MAINEALVRLGRKETDYKLRIDSPSSCVSLNLSIPLMTKAFPHFSFLFSAYTPLDSSLIPSETCFQLQAQSRLFSPPNPLPLSYGISRILRSLHHFDHCQVTSRSREANFIAVQVAESVTRDQRSQSYMAAGGPSWLSSSITAEARNAGPY